MVVWQYLCRSNLWDVHDAEDFVALFFRMLFTEVRKEIEQVFSERLPLQPRDFALEWRRYLSMSIAMQTMRQRLYQRVIDACEQVGTVDFRSNLVIIPLIQH